MVDQFRATMLYEVLSTTATPAMTCLTGRIFGRSVSSHVFDQFRYV